MLFCFPRKDDVHGNRFRAGQARAAAAPGPAVAEPAAGVSGVFSSGFFPASVLWLDEQRVALGVAAAGVYPAVVGHDDGDRRAAAANGPAHHVRNSYYAEHALPYSLANLFRDAGYSARSYHAANPNIYNRGQIHLNFGYESYNDYGDLGMDDYMLDSQLLRGYDQIVSDEPFFSFIITYSGHGPYTTEQQNISEPHLDRARAVIDYSAVPYTTEAQKEEYTRAVAQAMETDAFIGGLRERLEADGHAEDTVLVLFTDHYCKYFSDTELIEAIKGTSDHNLLSNVPFVIWTEGITPQVSEKYVSTMDIAPTIVDLFSLDTDLRYYIGNDMFGPDGGVVYFRNYAWYDGKTYDTGNDASTNPAVLAMREQVREQIDVSQDTFRSDYFAYLQKRSGETEAK